ncbi:MAG: RagB/SusD family nutrient uptake outer membrane protein [Cyclobacteriaceae bacterium]
MIAMLVTACNDILQSEEQTAIDGDIVFTDPSLTELYLNYIYGQTLPGFSGTRNAGLTEETVGGGSLIYGNEPDPTAGSGQDYSDEIISTMYQSYSVDVFAKLRNINLFIERVEDSPLDVDDKESFLGQAYFLRAWVNWNLVLNYGGVPLVVATLDNNDEISDELPRESASTCVDQIVSDLDLSIELIGDYAGSDYGRITRSAAAAFKGRVLLFYASPQFDPNGLSNADGIVSRWEVAYQANVEAKQIASEAGHALYPNFGDVFLVEDNEEVIMVRKYSVGSSHSYENSVRPWSAKNSGNASSTPSWNLVEAFPMKSGLQIDESGSGYDQDVYWKDRDPRFYATIAYNSSPWKFEDREDPRQWTYLGNEQEGERIPTNGFYLKKNVNTTISKTQTSFTTTDWIEIRYAEVLLNLAECANELGRTGEALDELYSIRERAGIDAGSGNFGITVSDKAGLREVILNERLVELAFENKRYWDLRRRNLYVNGIDGTPNAGFNGSRRERILTTLNTQYIIDNNSGIASASNPADSAFSFFEAVLIDTIDWDNSDNYANYFITSIEEAETVEINYLQPKYNFFYLPLNAITRNSKLVQTENWLDGTFDPLLD